MRNKLIIAAVVLVGLASVAYALFTQLLTINGTGTATGNWSVKITGISLDTTASSGATNNTAPFVTGTTSATFDAKLAAPGSKAVYNVTIKNEGSVDAKLSSLTNLDTKNAATPTYITYAVSGVQANDILTAGSTVTAVVTVTWDSADATSQTTGASKSATIDFNYAQN